MSGPLNEEEEFEFLYQMEKNAKRGIPPPNPAPVKASMGDVIAGTPLARVAMGAASPLIGAAQLGAHVGDVANRAMGVEPVVSPWIDTKLQEYEAAKERGMKAAGTEGTDWMGLMGSAAPTSAAAKAVPAGASWIGRILSAAGQGGLTAGTQPVVNAHEDFWTKKGLQTVLGTVVGGGLQTGGELLKGGANLVAPIVDMFRGQKGIENITRKGLEKNVGKEHVEAVADALAQARETVPGYKPTAAEALAYTPEGSPIQALQRITARTEGGPSAAFGERALKQQGAVKVAERTRNVLTAPMREEALSLANKGGVESRDVLEGLAGIRARPDLGASDVVSKSLDHLTEKINSLTDKTGKIDAEALYTVRKELGKTIGRYAKETQNWDKRLMARVEGDIQKGMDWAINNAIHRAEGLPGPEAIATGTRVGQRAITGDVTPPGPTKWDQYLSEYSRRSKDIADVLATKKLSLKPTQPTTLEASKNLATAAMPHVALLSRPVVIANALLSHLGKSNIEPKIDLLNQQLLLDPNRMGQFLRGVAPSRNQAMIEALMQQVPGAAGTVSGRAIGGY